MEKKKIIFIFALFFVVLAAILLLLFLYNYLNKRTNYAVRPLVEDIIDNNEQAQNTVNNEAPAPIIRTQPIDQTPREFGQKDLEQMASSFAERFGSFSNHSSFSNIVDLKVFMTENMKSWADEFILEKQKTQDFNAPYFGISTIAISEEALEYDEENGKAKISVITQRRESIGDVGNSTAYEQSIVVSFEKRGGAWKVNSADWQDKS